MPQDPLFLLVIRVCLLVLNGLDGVQLDGAAALEFTPKSTLQRLFSYTLHFRSWEVTGLSMQHG